MRKSQLNSYLVSIIAIMLSFIIIVGFYKFYLSRADAKAEAIACNSLVRGVDKLGKLTFLVNIKNKCKVSKYEIKSDNKEEVFKEIAEAMRDTWFKYGEGKYDFMSKFSGGKKWCFLGAIVKFDKKIGDDGNIDIKEFNEWLKNSKFKKGDKEVKYIDYFNYERFEGNEEEYDRLQKVFYDLLEEAKGDRAMELPAIVASDEFIKVSMLKEKQINTNKDLYIVYIFERPSKDLDSRVNTALIYGVSSAVAVEIITFWIPGAALKMVKKLGAVTKFFEILSLVRRISGFEEGVKAFKFLQPAKWREVKMILDEDGEVLRLAEIEKVGTVSKLLEESATVEKGYKNVEEALKIVRAGGGFGSDYEAIVALSKGINNKETKKIAEKIIEIMKRSDLKNIPNDPNILYNSLKPEDRKLYTELTDLVFKRPISIEEDRNGVGFLTGLRIILESSALVGGGYVGAIYNSNNIQYLALMSPEEYYMVCGG